MSYSPLPDLNKSREKSVFFYSHHRLNDGLLCSVLPPNHTNTRRHSGCAQGTEGGNMVTPLWHVAVGLESNEDGGVSLAVSLPFRILLQPA